MRSKIAKRIYDETPADIKIFVRKHSDIAVRVYQLLQEKGWSQKDLANKLDKTQSEISKWLNGEHNFTLKSIAKLEAELGAEIIYVPKRDSFHVQRCGNFKAAVNKTEPISTNIRFQEPKKSSAPLNEPMAA